MSDDEGTIEQLRAALAAAEARALAAESRATALENLITLVPGTLIVYEQHPEMQSFQPVSIGGAGVAKMFGYSNEEALSDPEFFRRNIHPEDIARVGAEVISFFEKGQSYISPHRMRRKDGTYAWVETLFMYGTAKDKGMALNALMFDVTERIKTEHELRATLTSEQKLRQRLDGFVASVPGIVWESYFQAQPDAQRLDFVSESVEKITGYSADEWFQPNFWLEMVIPEDKEHAHQESYRIAQAGSGLSSYRWRTKDGRIIWVTTQMMAIRDDDGNLIGLRGITMDVTEEKRVEAEIADARLREGMLRAQEESLLALSTPLVPIDDDVLAMTLVGNVDERRAERVLLTLLEGVNRSSARVVILDVTGVPVVNEQTADALLRAARAVRLLGADVVLTGIRPEVARTLVTLEANLGSIVTKSTLKAGIAYALAQKKMLHR
jgi:rsbT co-antagonist protein RsbR